MKKCSQCKAELPSEFFHKREASKDGLSNECKDCRKNRNKYRPSPSAKKRLVENLLKQLKPTDY